MQGKVEICGVNTARLKVLSQKDMDKLLLRAKDGDEDARQQLVEGNLRLVLSVIQRFDKRGEKLNPYRVVTSQLSGVLPLTAGNDRPVHKGIYRRLLAYTTN